MRTLAKDQSQRGTMREIGVREACFMHAQGCHSSGHTGKFVTLDGKRVLEPCKMRNCRAICGICKAEAHSDAMAAWERQRGKLHKAASLWLKAVSGSPNVALKAQAELEEMGI